MILTDIGICPAQRSCVGLYGTVDVLWLSVIEESDLDDIHTCLSETVHDACHLTVPETPIVYVPPITQSTIQKFYRSLDGTIPLSTIHHSHYFGITVS